MLRGYMNHGSALGKYLTVYQAKLFELAYLLCVGLCWRQDSVNGRSDIIIRKLS